jgi:hypothetical protein
MSASSERRSVSATVLYMSMSLDGFIAGPNEGPDNALGDGGHRLHEWYFADDADRKGVNGQGSSAEVSSCGMRAG